MESAVDAELCLLCYKQTNKPFLTLQTCGYVLLSLEVECNEKKDVQEIASVLDLKIDNEKKVLDVLPN